MQWITYKPLKRISEFPKEGYYNMIPSQKVFTSWVLIIRICVEWGKVKIHEMSMVNTVCQMQNLGQNLFNSVILCVRLSHKNRTYEANRKIHTHSFRERGVPPCQRTLPFHYGIPKLYEEKNRSISYVC